CEIGKQVRTGLADWLDGQVQQMRQRWSVGPTVHQALDGYGGWVRQECRDDGPAGISPRGKRYLGEVEVLKRVAEDVPLSRFGLDEIEQLLALVRQRPAGKRGRKVSATYAADLIKRVRH